MAYTEPVRLPEQAKPTLTRDGGHPNSDGLSRITRDSRPSRKLCPRTERRPVGKSNDQNLWMVLGGVT